jgi:formate dehydrogenase maturation protein FdhE
MSADGGEELDAYLAEHPRVANRLARRVERWQANGSPSLEQRLEQREQFLAEHPDIREQVDALRAQVEQFCADHPEWVELLASLENASFTERRAAVEQFLEDNPETAADLEEHRREIRELRREIRNDIAQEREESGN